MRQTTKELVIWAVMFIMTSLIGSGIAILVTKAIDYTRQTACFDYKTPEACEEIRNEEI